MFFLKLCAFCMNAIQSNYRADPGALIFASIMPVCSHCVPLLHLLKWIWPGLCILSFCTTALTHNAKWTAFSIYRTKLLRVITLYSLFLVALCYREHCMCLFPKKDFISFTLINLKHLICCMMKIMHYMRKSTYAHKKGVYHLIAALTAVLFSKVYGYFACVSPFNH